MRPALGLALAAPRDAAGWARALARVERAEALGLHSVWLPEGHFRPGATPSPLVALAAFAVRTRRLRLATTSLLLPIHHPLRVAAEVATLDAISGGRVLLGLGRGFQPALFAAFGVAAGDKRDRFDEALDAILRAWSGQPLRLDGAHWGVAGGPEVRVGVTPVQRPHPPLVVAAFGRRGLLQAARRGLPYLASPLESLAALEENQALWRAHCATPTDPRAPAVPVMRTVHVARDDAEAARVREALAGELRPPAAGPVPAAFARAASEPLAERVVVGTAGAVAAQLARYRERLGMDLLVVRSEVPGASEAEREASLERLAGAVWPAVAGTPAGGGLSPPPAG